MFRLSVVFSVCRLVSVVLIPITSGRFHTLEDCPRPCYMIMFPET